MSMPPPGHETPRASSPPLPFTQQGTAISREDANAQNVSRQAGDDVQYEVKSVKALRGRESSAKAKWQSQGWELVSENRGTLRTELSFRRAKPKMIGDYLLSALAGLKRLPPKTRSVLVASGALILVAGSVGFAVGTRSDGDTADPTATPIKVEALLDDAEPSERRAKARARARAKARARARVKRRERALERERQRNTALLQAGVTCAELGQSDIAVTPGVDIDADGDGVGCES
jgi:hypothetical protein